MHHRITQLIEQLSPQIQRPPIQGTLPLAIQGRWAGFIWPAALAELKGHPQLQHHETYVEINSASLSTSLNQIAQQLRESGCLPFWRDEQVHVWGEGQILAQIERTATRPLGLLTQAVHLNAWTPDERVFLARRAPTKQTDPNMWDTLVGGLLNAHDTPEQGLLRESYEEAGLNPEHIQERSPIRLITRMRGPLVEGYQVEDILASDCILDPTVVPNNIDGEVSEIAHFAVHEVLAMMDEGLITTEAMIVLLDSFRDKYCK